jgi:hypothetical protein
MPLRDRDTSPADERFAALVELLAAEDGVTVGSDRPGFGAGTLQVNGRIFAMISHGRLVLKLPSRRVEALLDEGHGIAYDAGTGRPMKEWIALNDDSDGPWTDLAREALAFVAGQRKAR